MRGLIDGGCDLLLLETIVDTLNAKAAIVAIEEVFDEHGVAPAGDDLGDDHRSQRPHAVGPDDRRLLGVDRARAAVQRRHQLRARRARHAARTSRSWRASPTATSAATRTPGCRTRSASTTSCPADTAGYLREFADERLGEHRRRLLRHDARSHRGDRRGGRRACRRAASTALDAGRQRIVGRASTQFTQFAGLETLTIRPDSNFQMIGERTNVTGSARFARLIRAGDYAEAAQRRARSGARRRQPPRRQHGRGHARLRAGDDRLPELHRAPSRRSRACRSWSTARSGRCIEAGLKCVQGKPVVNSISLKEGEEDFLQKARARQPLRRRRGRDGVRRAGPGRHDRAQGGDLPARLPAADRAGRLRPDATSSSIRTSWRSPPGSRSTTTTRSTSSRRRASSRRPARA